MKPACVPCQRFYRCKKNDFYFLEGMQSSIGNTPDVMEPKWEPYRLWAADLWECEGCGAQILSGYGKLPISEHYKPEFAETVERFGATLQINDC